MLVSRVNKLVVRAAQGLRFLGYLKRRPVVRLILCQIIEVDRAVYQPDNKVLFVSLLDELRVAHTV